MRVVRKGTERLPNSNEGYRAEYRTLSVSIVATSSSAFTNSPGFFSHDLRVPSEMDSAICGTLTVAAGG